VVLGGAVQDLVVLFSPSMRRNRQITRANGEGGIELRRGVHLALAIPGPLSSFCWRCWAGNSEGARGKPWGVFTVGATIPIAMLMGGYLRFRAELARCWRPRAMGVALLPAGGCGGGQFVHGHAALAKNFHPRAGAAGVGPSIVYGLAASVLPIWRAAWRHAIYLEQRS